MKAGTIRRLNPLCLLALSCSVFLGGCSRISGPEETGQPARPQSESSRQAEGELINARAELERAKKEAGKAAADVESADRAAQEAQPAGATGRDDGSPDESKETPAEKKKREDAEKKLEVAKKASAAAQVNVQNAQKKVEAAEEKFKAAQGASDDSSSGWLSYLILGLLALAAVAAAAYLLNRILGESRERAQRAFGSVESAQKQYTKHLDASISELGRRVDAHFAEQRKLLDSLDRRISETRQDMTTLRGAVATQQSAYPNYQGAVAEVKEQPPFPAAASEYLNRVQRSATIVTSDSLNDILVKDPDGTGEMALVEDPSVPGGLLFVVPTAASFKTKQDFYTYYEKYFDCHRLTGGEVWIVEPATVNRVNGGWKLLEKGELEVR